MQFPLYLQKTNQELNLCFCYKKNKTPTRIKQYAPWWLVKNNINAPKSPFQHQNRGIYGICS